MIGLPTEKTAFIRASDILRGRGPAKFRYFREIPKKTRNTAKSARNISKYMSIKHIYYLSWLLDRFYSRPNLA